MYSISVRAFTEVRDYAECWQAMRALTAARAVAIAPHPHHSAPQSQKGAERAKPHTKESLADQLWLVEHPPVFTGGRRSPKNAEPIRGIPYIATDRGGQITYHGPGQAVFYPLIDIKARGLGIRTFVALLEDTTIACLAAFHILAHRVVGKPGIYTACGKIASLGLAYKKGGVYHGLSLNVAMDLAPFSYIAPCGEVQPVCQVADFCEASLAEVQTVWKDIFLTRMANAKSHPTP